MGTEELCDREMELALQRASEGGQRDRIQHYRNSHAKWLKAIPLSHLCNGEDERPGAISRKRNHAGTSPLVCQSFGRLSQQTEKVRNALPLVSTGGFSYFVKVRILTYLHSKKLLIFLQIIVFLSKNNYAGPSVKRIPSVIVACVSI